MRKIYRKTKEGEEQAFNQLFKTYFNDLVFYGCRFVDKETAEDIVQDIFVYIWENKSKIEMGNSFISYLYKLVYNKSLNVIKHMKIRDKTANDIVEKTLSYYSPYKDDVLEKLISSELSQELNDAISQLPERGQQCIVMRYIQQHKVKDIALALDVSPRTVETHLYRSLKTLYEIMQKRLHYPNKCVSSN